MDKTFHKGKYFIWEITNEYGWAISTDELREFNIDIVLNNLEGNEDTKMMLMVKNSESKNYMEDDYWVVFRYEKGQLTFKNIKFKLTLEESEEFIMKVIRDNNWEIPPLHDLNYEPN
jgi:hypothetical protein